MTNADAFRKLRAAWFNEVLKTPGTVGAHETPGHAQRRFAEKRFLRILFDNQTEEIILGKDCPIAPRCEQDMERR
jgi:hypothetical protein